jgi:glucose-1-phosphate adenylyltransferase
MRATPLNASFDLARVLVMILAGGEGRRLGPLSSERAKPAVPFGGRYRIIDIVLSNFVNSGLNRIKILTQYKSASLEEHIARSWRLSPMMDSFIETIPAQQRTGKNWFLGSADAVYQCLNVVHDQSPDLVCIFGGDHIYKMDVRHMLGVHVAQRADVSIAAVPVPIDEARAFGVLEVDADNRVRAFHEKVDSPPPMPGNPDMALASMGNYVFNTDILRSRLREDAQRDTQHDFGRNILPEMVERGDRVFAYDFNTNKVPGEDEERSGYWRDIGTIDAYFRAQLDLVAIEPKFNLYNRRWPVRTGMTHDPPAKFVFHDQNRIGMATESLVSAGCIVSGGRLHRSVLGLRCRINSFSDIQESILLGNVNIGRHARIRRAIIDKNVVIPPGTEIGFDLEADRKRWFVSEGGIVVIPKGAEVPPPE